MKLSATTHQVLALLAHSGSLFAGWVGDAKHPTRPPYTFLPKHFHRYQLFFMKKTLLYTFIAMLAVVNVGAQYWRSTPQFFTGGIATNTVETCGLNISNHYDSCSKSFFILYGMELARSSDLGLVWHKVPRDLSITMSKYSALIADQCVTFMAWHDLSRGQQTWVSVVNSETDSIETVSIPDSVVDYLAVGSSGTTVASLVNRVQGTGVISTDKGSTWYRLETAPSVNTSRTDYMLRPRPGVLAAYYRAGSLRREGWWEIAEGNRIPHPIALPPDVHCYAYANDSIIVCGMANEMMNRKSIVALVNIRDSSVRVLDSLYCVNTGTYLSTIQPGGSIKRYQVAAIKVDANGAFTMWFQRGDIVSSTDGGTTWYNRHPLN
jgi:hypothetical protein